MNVNNVRSKEEEGLARRMRESEGKCCGAGSPRPVDFLSYRCASPRPSDLDSVQAFPVSPGDLQLLEITTRCFRGRQTSEQGRKTNANTGAAPHFRVMKCDRLISRKSSTSADLTDHKQRMLSELLPHSLVCVCG